jgi:hypothetical protein
MINEFLKNITCVMQRIGAFKKSGSSFGLRHKQQIKNKL